MNVSQTPTRLVSPQTTVLTTGTRISAVTTPQPTILGSTQGARLVTTTQANTSLGRLNVAAVTPAAAVGSNTNLVGQARISNLNLHSLVAVANTSQARPAPAQTAPKVITQQTPGEKNICRIAIFCQYIE